MWTEFLNLSRSQHKFTNKNLLILGSKHSGKRSLVDSLFDISKTTLHTKRPLPNNDNNKMRLRGLTTAIDYAYLNVVDIADPDYRTHSKLEIHMIEDAEHPAVYAQLADPAFLRNSILVLMLDFTAPWNFIAEIEQWVRFVIELQKMAGLSIADLEQMAEIVQQQYQDYRQPEFDEHGKLKLSFGKEQEDEESALPLPEGVLGNNIRLPFIICVNKCDLQSQVLREESNSKILVILYHLRTACIKYGATLIYTSIRNNCNLNVLYEYILHRAYRMPLSHKPEPLNQDTIFIPLGYDNPTLISDSVVKIDVSKSYSEVVAAPISKKSTKEEILVEEDSKFFEKYINQAQLSSNNNENPLQEKEERPMQRKKEEVKDYFLSLMRGERRESLKPTQTQEQSQRQLNAERELIKHAAQVMERRAAEE